MIKYIARFVFNSGKVRDRMLMHLYTSLFCHCGRNVIFFPTNSKFTYNTISVGNNVSIGYGASFIATLSHISIGDNTMFGSNVTIRGGTHSSHIIGKLMRNYTCSDKVASDDGSVVIDDDVLVETGVIILKNVHIGRGAVVNAGVIVTEDVPPYAVIDGFPARVIRYRWSQPLIIRHEELTYAPDKRLPIELICHN